MDRTIIFFADVNPLRAYSGIKYLCQMLLKHGFRITLYAPIPVCDLKETYDWGFPVRSYIDNFIFHIPFIDKFAMRHKVLVLIMNIVAKRNVRLADRLIFSNYLLWETVIYCRRKYPQKKIIHYCFEYFTPDEYRYSKRELLFYEKHPRLADLVIDVEINRARLRKDRYMLASLPEIIPNTIPLWITDRDIDAKRLGSLQFPTDRPILCFTGAALYDRGLDAILTALKQVKKPIFTIGFLYGSKKSIDDYTRKFLDGAGRENIAIFKSVPRDYLIRILSVVSIGLVYYPIEVEPSKNQLYCAPSKMYEFLSAGVPIVTSSNPGLVEFVNDNGLGVAASCNSPAAIATAIDLALDSLTKDPLWRQRIKQIFRDKLSYEVSSQKCFERLHNILNNER